MKYCSKCGSDINDDAVICPKCGCMVDDLKEKSNGMAIAGFVCSFFIPVLGIVFGAIGISKSSKLNGRGKGMGIAAIIISIISWLISFAVLYNYYYILFSRIF